MTRFVATVSRSDLYSLARQQKCPARLREQGVSFEAGLENNRLLNPHHFLSLFALRPLDQFVLDHLSFVERFEPIHLDRRIVNEDVSTAFRLFDKAEAFGVVEPFNFALFLLCHGDYYLLGIVDDEPFRWRISPAISPVELSSRPAHFGDQSFTSSLRLSFWPNFRSKLILRSCGATTQRKSRARNR